MKTKKVYKSKIGTKLAILTAKIKNFFNGSHYVAETFSTKYNSETKEYTLEHYTLTREEDEQLHNAITMQQEKIMQMIIDESPVMHRQKTKEEKWAEDVERNRQKQLAENKAKKNAKAPAKTKATKTDTPIMAAKPKRKYTKKNKTDKA